MAPVLDRPSGSTSEPPTGSVLRALWRDVGYSQAELATILDGLGVKTTRSALAAMELSGYSENLRSLMEAAFDGELRRSRRRRGSFELPTDFLSVLQRLESAPDRDLLVDEHFGPPMSGIVHGDAAVEGAVRAVLGFAEQHARTMASPAALPTVYLLGLPWAGRMPPSIRVALLRVMRAGFDVVHLIDGEEQATVRAAELKLLGSLYPCTKYAARVVPGLGSMSGGVVIGFPDGLLGERSAVAEACVSIDIIGQAEEIAAIVEPSPTWAALRASAAAKAFERAERLYEKRLAGPWETTEIDRSELSFWEEVTDHVVRHSKIPTWACYSLGSPPNSLVPPEVFRDCLARRLASSPNHDRSDAERLTELHRQRHQAIDQALMDKLPADGSRAHSMKVLVTEAGWADWIAGRSERGDLDFTDDQKQIVRSRLAELSERETFEIRVIRDPLVAAGIQKLRLEIRGGSGQRRGGSVHLRTAAHDAGDIDSESVAVRLFNDAAIVGFKAVFDRRWDQAVPLDPFSA